MRRQRLCFIATEWGSSEGGESVLNMRLVVETASKADVTCVVLRSPSERPANVALYWVDGQGLSAEEISTKIIQEVPVTPDWWIGHDVHTGAIANACRRGLELSCVLNHMDYLSYKPFERDPEALQKSDLQAHIFQGADVVAAVGPKLHRTVRDLAPSTRKVLLVPGCEDFKTTRTPERFALMVSGRLTEKTDAIKQHGAAILAFAECVRERALGVDPVLTVVGADEVSFDKMRSVATERAQGACNIVNAGKVPAGSRYAALLARQSVVVVPSIYEGFSLVGWEALSAGIPVILSRNTGLAEFIEGARLPDAAVELVQIQGHMVPEGGANPEPNAHDIKSLKEAYVRLHNDYHARKRAADEARSALRASHAWADMAASFVANLAGILTEKYYAIAIGVRTQAEHVIAGALSAKISVTTSLASSLRRLARSVLVPREDQLRLERGQLDAVSDETLMRTLEAWTEFPWDLYVSYSDKKNETGCLDWLLGITVPVKGRRVFGVTPAGIDGAALEAILQQSLRRTRPETPFPSKLTGHDEQLVAEAVTGLAERLVLVIRSRQAPPHWVLVIDPRIRAAIAVDEKKLKWRKEPVR